MITIAIVLIMMAARVSFIILYMCDAGLKYFLVELNVSNEAYDVLIPALTETLMTVQLL